jgi:hypothetical protein
MKTKFYTLLFILVSLLYQACETDFDLTANWKETTVIYGVLSQNQKVQYVRINKAFLGDGNALQFSQIADSINFDTAIIRAKIYVSQFGGFIDSINLKPKLLKRDKNLENPFYNQNFDSVLVYQTEPHNYYNIVNSDTNWLNPGTTEYPTSYLIVINNLKSGKVIKAQTSLVQDFTFSKPNYISTNPMLNIKDSDAKNLVKWKSAENGKRVEALYRFYYKEFTNSTDSVTKYVDYNLGTFKSENILGLQEFETYFSGTDFHKTLTSKIPANPNIKRVSYRIELIFTVVPEEFSTYLDVNEPSTGIVQERPEYSNIDGGLGIFSSRYQKTKMFKIGPNMENDIVDRFNAIDGSFILAK